MSISTIQEKILNKGCGSAVIIASAVALFLTTFSQCNSANKMNAAQSAGAVATVDNVPVTSEMIGKFASAQQQMPGARGESFSAYLGLQKALQQAAGIALMEKSGTVTESEIVASFDRLIKEQRAQFENTGQLKAGASEAEFEKLIKTQSGKSIADLKKEFVKDRLDAYKDPQKRIAVQAQLADLILPQRLGKAAVASDDKLRESYKTYTVKRIFLSPTSGASESVDARAAKVEAELKAGKSFDSLMDTVSNDPAPAGKKAHDASETIDALTLESRSELASLKGRASGTNTPIVSVPGGKAIYTIVKVSDNLPKDFEAKKESYRAQQASLLGQQEASRQILNLIKTKTTWNHKGYEAFAKFATGDQAGAEAAMKEGLASDDAGIKRVAALSGLLLSGPTKDAASQIATYENVFAAGIQDASLRVELAKLYGTSKNGAKATEALIKASGENTDYNVTGENLFRDIASTAIDLEAKKVITAAQLKEIQTAQAAWSESKKLSDQYAAEAKKQEEEARKANEAELARQKAEEEKKAKEAAVSKPKTEPAKPPQTTGGSLLPAAPATGQ